MKPSTTSRHLISIGLMLLAALAGCNSDAPQEPAYLITGIPVWDVVIPHDQYISLLNNRWSEEAAAAEIYVNGKRHRAEIEPQGAGSRYDALWSFRVTLEPGDTIDGIYSFNLSSHNKDDTRFRTLIGNALFKKAGFISFTVFPVFLRINGENKGVYTAIERVEDEFFRTHPEYPLDELIKVRFEARFTFKDGALKLDKSFDKKYPKNSNYSNLAEMINALDTTSVENTLEGMNKYLDVDQYLRYHALSSLVNHKDGFTNNFYFYKSHRDAPYRIIPWDYDQVFSYEIYLGEAGENDIYKRLMLSDTCRRIYETHLRNLLDTVMTKEVAFPLIDEAVTRIASGYSVDPNLRAQGADIRVEADKLKAFITRRREYFKNLLY